MESQDSQPQISQKSGDPVPPLPEPLAGLKFDANGLIPAIIQDWKTGQVLMMAWMNRDSLARTVQTARTHFFSRSRNKLWLKGESSGHVQHVKSLATDCDQDVVLVKVEQVGAACHEGYQSCFFREFNAGQAGQAEAGWKVVGTKLFDPEKVYKK
jgi:phosphoribosyl-AMP cyclohydrolase